MKFCKRLKNKFIYLLLIALSVQIVLGSLTGCSLDSVSGTVSEIGTLSLPENSENYSYTLALQLLGLSSGYTKDSTKQIVESAGLEVIKQENYDKDEDDPSHTSAYTIAKGNVLIENSLKNAYVITVRGTDSGEWYSNFDFAPSKTDDSDFSENFLMASSEIFLSAMDVIDEDDPLVIVCGHSRGAACANLLGVLFDDEFGSDNVYAYTFATPMTIHNGSIKDDYENIFNLINPCDIVPQIPLSKWGYSRAGVDIILPESDSETKDTVDEIKDSLYEVSDSVESYYSDRHSLNNSGLDEYGLTSFDLMIMFSDKLIELTDSGDDSSLDDSDFDDISKKSDFYPLVETMKKLTANNNELAIKLVNNHLPQAYQKLITLNEADSNR